MGKAKIARGRTIHVCAGRKIVVGTRRHEANGTIVYRDVTANETRAALPGEEVELPLTEIKRLIDLGFLVAADGTANGGFKLSRAGTDVEDDQRVARRPDATLVRATADPAYAVVLIRSHTRADLPFAVLLRIKRRRRRPIGAQTRSRLF
jgi:hypothetical protein